MQLVGASKGFIQKPFLGKGILCGLLSAALAVIMLLVIIYAMVTYIPDIKYIIDWQAVGILFGSLIIGGILITVISTYFIVNRYIRLRKDDMF